MTFKKLSFPTAAAACALAMGLSTAPAFAFEEVDWEWNLKLDERITKTIDIDASFEPTGLLLLEDLQIHIGNLSATSNVNGVYNYQPSGAGSSEVDLGTLTLNSPYLLGGSFDSSGTVTGPNVPNATLTGGNVNETDGPQPCGQTGQPACTNNGTVTATIDLGTIQVTVAPGGIDAADNLPEVISAATAVANNVSIESEVMVEIHEGQFVFDTAESPSSAYGLAALLALGGWDRDHVGNGQNENLTLAVLGIAGAIGGVIDPATINASSNVSNILNASVDSSATAVGNNKSITVDAGPAEDVDPVMVALNGGGRHGNNHHNNQGGSADPLSTDQILIGDITQFAFANLTAVSSVSNVSVNNYTNLGGLGRALVSSTATAVGNNLSIKVGDIGLND